MTVFKYSNYVHDLLFIFFKINFVNFVRKHEIQQNVPGSTLWEDSKQAVSLQALSKIEKVPIDIQSFKVEKITTELGKYGLTN